MHALDKTEVPKVFYTPITEGKSHRDAFGKVLAETAAHSEEDWITVGFVSKQSPFGQGTYLGFSKDELREATEEEVRSALASNHPHGRKFRPICMEAANANFHLVMSKTFANWTNDRPRRMRPIHDVSRNELEEARDKARAKHNRMMLLWRLICWKQTHAIKNSFI